MSLFDLTPPDAVQRQRLIDDLNDDERRVLLQHGTQAPFCGGFLDHRYDGVYVCRLCGLPLFRSTAKYDSKTGWPSFSAPYDDTHLHRRSDDRYGMQRVEIACARCGSHLGHVFPDGPPPTHERHCLNSIALAFVVAGRPFPNPLGHDGAEAGFAD